MATASQRQWKRRDPKPERPERKGGENKPSGKWADLPGEGVDEEK